MTTTQDSVQKPSTPPEIGGIGHSVRRHEDDRFIAGQGNYLDDHSLPGMLHMAILRSPVAHARIKSIDTSAAAAVDGVVAVVTGELLAGYNLGVDADDVGRHPSGARHRQGPLPGPGGRRGRCDRPIPGGGRARAHRRRLRDPAGDHVAAAVARRRSRADPRRQGGAERRTWSTSGRAATKLPPRPRSPRPTES